MINFTGEQVHAFQASRFDAFLVKLVVRQIARHPKLYRGLSTSEVSRDLAPAIAKARELGFVSQKHMNQWADLAAAMGQQFDKQPWVLEIVQAGHPPDRTLDLISREAVFRTGKS